MLLNDDEIKETIESPLNLLNRLKRTLNHTVHPSLPSITNPIPPRASDIIDDLDDRLKNNSTRSKAVGILNAAMDELSRRLPEIERPESLARVAENMSKVISQQDTRNAGDKLLSQIIVYAPQVQKIEDYEVIEVVE